MENVAFFNKFSSINLVSNVKQLDSMLKDLHYFVNSTTRWHDTVAIFSGLETLRENLARAAAEVLLVEALKKED